MSKVKYKLFFIVAIITATFLFSINSVFADVNNITHINFVSDEQTVKKDEISKVFTIQTQNINDIAEEITESTNKLTLSTDSSTGEFSSSNSDWKSTNIITMNKGTKNKNFYYKDGSIGNFTITVQLVSGETSKTWITTQVVNISDSLIVDDPIDDDVSTTTATSTTNTNSTSTVSTTTIITQTKTRYVYVSAHSSSEELSDYISGNTLEISAGRDRISYVGIPVDFDAKHNKKDGRVNFTWSFGDGTSETGQEISHVYKNTGDYIVILNSKNSINDAVSRTNIKILEPDLSMSIVRGGLEVANNGDYEINIGDWKVSNGYTDIFIPKDTIIASKNKIVIPDNVFTEFQDFTNISLINQSGNMLISSNEGNNQVISLNNKENLVANESLEKILGMKIEDVENIVYTYKSNMALDKKIKESKFENINDVVVSEKKDNLATVGEVMISTTTEGVLKKIIYSPIRGVKNMFGRFYDL